VLRAVEFVLADQFRADREIIDHLDVLDWRASDHVMKPQPTRALSAARNS
jgi:hypothetical protein